MATRLVADARIRPLNDEPARGGDYVLYWMQQSQRAEENHALEYAVQRANDRGLPLLVGFGLTAAYPEANLRHYAFLLQGLVQTRNALARRGIPLVVRPGEPDGVALELGRRAALVVADRGYLRHQVAWRRRVAEEAGREVVEVESDVVVPVEVASDKAEYAARTLRPRLRRHLDEHLVALRTTPLERSPRGPGPGGLDLDDAHGILADLAVERSVPAVTRLFRGGTGQARAVLRDFLANRLPRYAENRNQPQTDDVSHLAMYLHYGQISPVYVALQALDSGGPDEDVEAFLEELLVRRELAVNFVRYEPRYDAWEGLPEWARKTLAAHRDDPREHRYSRVELEGARTHDPYWNAAMREMRHTGYMHNYMRMYWGKKILEWSETPEEAFERCLALNNRYFLDGRDPGSFAGVAWVFGRHDRPWAERSVFGTVRYMSAGGLERKCDIGAYVEKVDRLVDRVSVT